jgi:DNA-binding MarR family transcriptional regulator
VCSSDLEHFDITVEQFHILRHIHRGVNSVSGLASERRISRPAVSQVVDVLAHKGLLTRLQDTDDRRHVKLVLTESGAALLKDIFDTNRAWMTCKLGALNQDELTACIQAMQTLKRTFDETVD